ncbi:MAG: DUF4325 domain-containing protein [Methylobacter sp.]|nr:DUF4325 domain-containing protein [Methylobacter sp.]
MISLKELFKSGILTNQGTRLSKIITEKLINSEDKCLVDFDGVSNVSPLFFQDFIFPIVIEFGSHALNNKLRLINLKDDHLISYRAACDQSSDYLDKLSARQTRSYGDISDLTLELLIKARELARLDPSAAQTIFGINSSMVKTFSNMDIELIHRIANTGVICFEPRFSPEFAARLAALDASEIDVFLNIVGNLEDFYEPGYA